MLVAAPEPEEGPQVGLELAWAFIQVDGGVANRLPAFHSHAAVAPAVTREGERSMVRIPPVGLDDHPPAPIVSRPD